MYVPNLVAYIIAAALALKSICMNFSKWFILDSVDLDVDN